MNGTMDLNRERITQKQRSSIFHDWILMDYDAIQELEQLATLLSGPGGTIEQTSLYLDPISALNWLEVSCPPDYVKNLEAGLQFYDVGTKIHQYYEKYYPIETLDIILLGPADGKKEVSLVQYLLQAFKSIRLLLVEVSQPLLHLALQRASASLEKTNLDLFAILGSFHQLSGYFRWYSPPSPKRKRLVTMLGHTWTTLSNEIFFLQNALVGLEPGDLFLVDFTMGAAPADQTEEVMKREPRLTGANFGTVDRAYEQFFTSTLERYCDGFQSAQFYSTLNNSSVTIPGSYAIERRAKVKATGHPDREFTMMVHKRYDLEQFLAQFRQEGFSPVQGWSFGKNKERMMYLFEKVPSPR